APPHRISSDVRMQALQQLGIRHDNGLLPAVCLQMTYMPDAQQHDDARSEEHTSELQSRFDIVCRLLLEKKKRGNDTRGKCTNYYQYNRLHRMNYLKISLCQRSKNILMIKKKTLRKNQ